MNINSQTLISDIVTENYETAAIFKKYKVDFCCNGNRTLFELSEDSDIDLKSLIDEVESIVKRKTVDYDYTDWDIDFLSDYIYQNHHRYIERQIPEIKSYLEKICRVHGEKHPELFEIDKLFSKSAGDLVLHMKKEELILFPYIKKIAKSSRSASKLETPSFISVENPIKMMHEEHNDEGERFREIAKLSNDYTPPKSACSSYKIAFKLLQEFEEDLHKHIHLENNILFKKAIVQEEQLNTIQ